MEKKNVTLTLTVEELNISIQALAKLPYEVVYAIIDKLSRQAQESLRTQETPKED